jgi:hypothetical protein
MSSVDVLGVTWTFSLSSMGGNQVLGVGFSGRFGSGQNVSISHKVMPKKTSRRGHRVLALKRGLKRMLTW